MGKKNFGKALFVTYNGIDGYPKGLYEDDNIIALSGEYGRNGFKSLYRTATNQLVRELVFELAKTSSAKVMAGLNDDVDELLDRVSTAYIYCGLSGLDTARDMVYRMNSKGIETTLVGCECNYSEKIETAMELCVDFVDSECGGYHTLRNIAEKYKTKKEELKISVE